MSMSNNCRALHLDIAVFPDFKVLFLVNFRDRMRLLCIAAIVGPLVLLARFFAVLNFSSIDQRLVDLVLLAGPLQL